MTDLAVLIPVLGRPGRVKPTLDAFNTTVPGARVLFLASPGDTEELQALESVDADMTFVAGGYSNKIRAGVYITKQSLIFTASDDVMPQHNWFENAREHLKDGIEVVGVNDLLRRPHRPQHATHFLMTRAYAEQPTIDGKPGPFSSAYAHNFCDDELIATAVKRGVYAYAPESRVAHRHPMGGAPDDDTYRLGRSRFKQDKRIFEKRSKLWA